MHQLGRQTQHLSPALEGGCSSESQESNQESKSKSYLILLNNYDKFVAKLATSLHLSMTSYRGTRIEIVPNNVRVLSLERAAAARFYSVDLQNQFTWLVKYGPMS